MPEPRRIMTVFPHPDDETSGLGGAISMSAAEGGDVYVICATRGELGALGTNEVVREFGDDVGLDLDSIRGVATTPNTQVHVGDYWDSKVAALRRCRSQEDAQWVADVMGHMTGRSEYFHQGYPPRPEGTMGDGLWS